MTSRNPESTARIAGHPIHPMLIPFPVAFFVTTFATDLAYWWTRSEIWATASRWLLGAGLAMGAIAAVVGLIDFLGDKRIRDLSASWQHFIGNLIAIGIALANFVWRYTSGPDVILSGGLLLSLAVVLILLFTGWRGWDMVYRHRVGVEDRTGP